MTTGQWEDARMRVIVVGAGAAGTMAAIFAADRGADVVLVESSSDGGRKILISGGGRCNVLPAVLDESRFVTSSSPNLLKKMLRSWPLTEQRAFFEHALGIPLVEETESRKLFPASRKARDVRDGLLSRAHQHGVQLRTNSRVTSIESIENNRWRVNTDAGNSIEGDRVVIATGGLSVPATGSDGTGLRLLQQLGHELKPAYAALTPVTSNSAEFAALAGISLDVGISAASDVASAQAHGGFLFTHRGYSGPSVLDVSHVVVRARLGHSGPATLRVQWTPLRDREWEEAFTPRGSRTVAGAVRAKLPDRLADVLIQEAKVDSHRLLSELRRDERHRLVETLVRFNLPWNGDEGYKKAEVTGGGVALSEIDPATLESRRCPGLYLCGEVLDAFGPIGGYNFCWAWATGRLAGIAASTR